MSKSFVDRWIALRDASGSNDRNRAKWELIHKARHLDNRACLISVDAEIAEAPGFTAEQRQVLLSAAVTMYEEFPDIRFAEIPAFGVLPTILEGFVDHLAEHWRTATGKTGRVPMSDLAVIATVMIFESTGRHIYDPLWLMDSADEKSKEAAHA